MKYLYRLYQLFIAVPLFIVWTIIISLTVVIGCTLGGGHWFGYYPGKAWGWLSLKLFLLPVRVEGRENLKEGESYVFVSNHQSMFDIFLIFGHLGRQFKWMMKYQLKNTPGTAACQDSLSITNSQSLLQFMCTESVMPFNHLILYRPLLLLPSIFPSVRVFTVSWRCTGIKNE